MADIPSAARVVIGGGVVGTHVFIIWPNQAGATVLLENELTAGSTWHAAEMPTFQPLGP